MANKGKRFKEEVNITENPGPGSYNLSKRSDWIHVNSRKASSAPPAMEDAAQGGHVSDYV